MAMVSRLGTEAAAALMPANLAVFCLIGVGMGMMSSVNTFSSQSLGRNRPEEGGAYLIQGLAVSLGIGLLALPLIWFVPTVAAWFGHAPEVRALEEAYARIGLVSVGPSVAAVGASYYFVGMHRPRVAMFASLLEVVVNFVANYALIFGKFGFPAMGVSGCAWSTVLASSVRLAFLLFWFWSARYRREFRTGSIVRIDLPKMRRLLRVGLPVGLTFGSELVCWSVFTVYLVGRFGTAHLAANNFVFQYLHVSFMPAVGVGMALCALIGKAMGQGDHRLVVRRAYLGAAICVGWMGLCGASLVIFREPLMRLWTDDPEVILLGCNLMICCAVFQVFDGLGIASMNALLGAGDTFRPGLYNAAYGWGVMVLGGWLIGELMPEWTSLGSWIMAATFIILISITLCVRFLRGGWRRIDIFREEQEGETAPVAESVVRPAESE